MAVACIRLLQDCPAHQSSGRRRVNELTLSLFMLNTLLGTYGSVEAFNGYPKLPGSCATHRETFFREGAFGTCCRQSRDSEVHRSSGFSFK